MIYKFTDNDNLLTLPKDKLLNKLGSASETEIKVLLYAASVAENGSFDEKAIEAVSGYDLTEIVIALQFWRGAEVLCLESQKGNVTASAPVKTAPKVLQKDEIPSYSGEEIAKLFEENAELKLIVDECQKNMGKIFNPLETNKIVALYDYLGLSGEYILNVCNYCTQKRKGTVHYLEKTAFNLYNEGVDTDEKLRDYLKKKEASDSFEGKIRRIFGLGTRALTKAEEKLLAKWLEIYNMPFELIEYAYELTVNATGKPSLPYAGRIMENWFNSGYTTVEQVKENEASFKKKKEAESASESSFDNDEFFEAALKRSYDNIGKKPN